MNGHIVNLDPIIKFARSRGIKVLEDACQCVGGSYRGQRVGRHGDAGAYSFNFFKNITCGEGGALVSSDIKLMDRARVYHDGGAIFRQDAKGISVPPFAGVNYRFDEIRAAVMRVQLQRLDEILNALRRRCHDLREKLQGHIELAPVHDLDGDCGASIFLTVGSRAEALAFVKAAGERKVACYSPFDSGRHVYSNWDPLFDRRCSHNPKLDPLHASATGRAQQYTRDMLPKTTQHLERTICVSIDLNWTGVDIERVSKALIESAQTVERTPAAV
jgi:dTDP-4-amino-4,6-dideoxygalactose transaminase